MTTSAPPATFLGSQSKTLTYDAKTIAVTAINTGLGVGALTYLFMQEGAFVKPAAYSAIAAAATYYLLPAETPIMRSAATGALYSALLYMTVPDATGAAADMTTLLRHAASIAVASHISTEYISPKLLRLERRL